MRILLSVIISGVILYATGGFQTISTAVERVVNSKPVFELAEKAARGR